MRKGQPPFGGCPQRVEKGVNAQKCAALRAEKTARNRAEFRFLASGCRTTVLPPSKKRKAQCRINDGLCGI